MKAMVNQKFGPPEVLELKEVDKPVISNDEFLIKTHATTVNKLDIVFRSGMKAMLGLVRLTTGIRRPKRTILGFDIAGEVVEVGKDVKVMKIGDKVFGGSRSGCNAEYAVGSEKSTAKMPSNLSYEEAAAIPMAGLTALQSLRDSGKISTGQKVLIYGASGGIGTFSVQLAKYFGATVVGVASGKNDQTVRNLGADDFVDYTSEDFTKREMKYDLIIDTVGKLPFSKWKKSLRDEGIFVNVGSPNMSMINFIRGMMGNKFRKRKYVSVYTEYTREDLEFLSKLCEKESIKPLIDQTYTFAELPEAHRYYEKGRSVGKVIVTIP